MIEAIIAFALANVVLLPMAWFTWESSKLVSEKKSGYGISSGEEKSKQKHMDNIL
tara:strand:- start:11061 stop:11225 length:165 start_codon:yes stop_codon:yes gene_type:complete